MVKESNVNRERRIIISTVLFAKRIELRTLGCYHWGGCGGEEGKKGKTAD